MGTGRSGKLPTRNYAAVKRAPAFERHIIDTSEWACVNYRYVTGYHFGIFDVYKRARRRCKIFRLPTQKYRTEFIESGFAGAVSTAHETSGRGSVFHLKF
jgi:hypothetical protein